MTQNVQKFINSFSFQNRLEPPVRQHLKNVYGTLMMTCGAASVGACIDMFTRFQASLLSALISFGLMLMLIAISDHRKNNKLRIGYLLGFGFTLGMGLGPVLDYVCIVDPSIIVTALLGTTLAFACFSVAALLAERGSWLFLGGPLMTLVTSMLTVSLLNIFMQSQLVYEIELYLGLMVISGYVLHDTQLIIEKRRMGDEDFVLHALLLFIDFIGMLRRLLIILAQKEEQKRRRKKENEEEEEEEDEVEQRRGRRRKKYI